MRNYIFAAVASFLLLSGCAPKPATPIEDPVNDNIDKPMAKGWVTTADKTYLFKKSQIALGEPDSQSPFLVKLDPDTKYQTIDGFGAAMTWASCYNLLKMSEEDRTDLLKDLFDPENGLGIGLIRVSIGASDFNKEEYTWCDKSGIDNFAVDARDRDVVFPILREVYKINPDVKIIGSPWSVPKWMKMKVDGTGTFDSWTSGRLNPSYYADYAQYLVKWIQTMEAEGFKIEAITLQNEPLNKGNSMSTYMPWEDQRDFIKLEMGKALRDARLSTKILVFDHNYNYDDIASQKKYPLHIYEDTEASKYVAGSAWHNYGGSVSEMKNIHEAAPDKEIYFTEASIGTWNYNFSSSLMNDFKSIFLKTMEYYNKGVTLWNFVLDDNRGPYSPQDGSCKTCFGAVEVSSKDYKVIDRKTHYYNIAHASVAARPGAVRIGTSGYTDALLTYQAYKNPDGGYGVLIMNEKDKEQQLVFSDGVHSVKFTVPGMAIASLRW